MKKVVINICYGGFGLSEDAISELKKDGIDYSSFLDGDQEFRSHPALIKVVETLGTKSWGRHAKLKIVEIPDDVEFTVEEYDGKEWVAEKHRIWS